MHQVQYVDVSIGSRDGSTQRQSIVPTRIFDSPYQQFPLDAMTSLDVGDQHGPSPSCYLGAVHVVSKGSFLVTLLVEKEFVPIKIPNIASII